MPGSPEICLKPTRLTLNTWHSKRELGYGIYRYIIQGRIQNLVKHFRWDFFGKIANEHKLLSDNICKKIALWIFDRVVNTSMKFMWFYIFYAMVVSRKSASQQSNDKYCLCNVTWNGDNCKPSIIWKLIFRWDLKQKLAPQRQ